ncbi:MAG: hypothetical protein ABIV39_00815 [Verrucomicrobiota bacterium]
MTAHTEGLIAPRHLYASSVIAQETNSKSSNIVITAQQYAAVKQSEQTYRVSRKRVVSDLRKMENLDGKVYSVMSDGVLVQKYEQRYRKIPGQTFGSFEMVPTEIVHVYCNSSEWVDGEGFTLMVKKDGRYQYPTISGALSTVNNFDAGTPICKTVDCQKSTRAHDMAFRLNYTKLDPDKRAYIVAKFKKWNDQNPTKNGKPR